MSAKAFLDTNVLIYALARNDPRSIVAERLLQAGGRVSVQVLNEFVSVTRRKLTLAWPDVMAALGAVRTLCGDPIALDSAVHEDGVALAQRHRISIYDAMIVAAARSAKCEVVYTEDLQDGRIFGADLLIENPFAVP
jgi:predicted nucleic acid-binding protein